MQDLISNPQSRPLVFISHRSTDKTVAEILTTFLCGVGVPKDAVFCSSLPGNDIDQCISKEVKEALKSSAVNIAILSGDYYESAYCLNEAGILWFLDNIPVIPITLPEIDSTNMRGFLGNEYKLRSLDSDADISYIYDTIQESLGLSHVKTSFFVSESLKLKHSYSNYLSSRTTHPVPTLPQNNPTPSSTDLLSHVTTDDERIILYYIAEKEVRKASFQSISDWLTQNEIFGVNIENAFDLLSSNGLGKTSDENASIFELSMDVFRKLTSNTILFVTRLHPYIKKHQKLAAITFKNLWEQNCLDSTQKLFVAYLQDNKVSHLGARWMEASQIADIEQWENRNGIDAILSLAYGKCLEFFIDNNLVYASAWTSYDNPKEYTLYASLQNCLFAPSSEYSNPSKEIKEEYLYPLPF